MIDRRNYTDVKAHLTYRAEVNRDAENTQANRWAAMKEMLQWADETPLTAAPAIRPTWPTFVAREREDGSRLAQSTVAWRVGAARTFFEWARLQWPRRYRRISPLWLDSLQVPQMPEVVKARKYYTLEDVRKLVAVDDGTLRCLRIRAAAALMFVSGTRVGALVTLPIRCVDLDGREVRLWTAEGVQTKNGKTRTAFMLEIPDLLATIATYDAQVRDALPAGALWYANLCFEPEKEWVAVFNQSRYRAHQLRDDLSWLCGEAGLEYLSPHHFRHGFIVYSYGNARTAKQRKAISQNVGHADIATTDRVYARLSGDDQREMIAELGEVSPDEGLPDLGHLTWDQKRALMREWLSEAPGG